MPSATCRAAIHPKCCCIEVVCATFNLLPQFVIGTRRVATLQHQLAQQLARYYPVRVLEPPLPTPRIVECMQWHPSNQHAPALADMGGMEGAGGHADTYFAIPDYSSSR
jgi:hypothetical protein